VIVINLVIINASATFLIKTHFFLVFIIFKLAACFFSGDEMGSEYFAAQSKDVSTFDSPDDGKWYTLESILVN